MWRRYSLSRQEDAAKRVKTGETGSVQRDEGDKKRTSKYNDRSCVFGGEERKPGKYTSVQRRRCNVSCMSKGVKTTETLV